MEEGSEFFRRLQRGDMAQYPMFTSCCPGWVRFLKGQYPQLTGQLSTAKSPQQMFGSLTKSWLAQKLGVEPEKIFCVSIMPCVAKKAESELPTMATEHGPDVDLVLTTREFVRMLRADKIIPSLLPEEGLDDPMGVSTGAGVIFGTTGGVMEACPRSASFLLTGQNPDPEAFSQLREGPDLREATYDLAGHLGALRRGQRPGQHPEAAGSHSGGQDPLRLRGGYGLSRRLRGRRRPAH